MQTFDHVGFGSLVFRTLSCFQMRPPRLFDTLSEIHLLLEIGFFVWTTVWTFGVHPTTGDSLSAHRIIGGWGVGCPMTFFSTDLHSAVVHHFFCNRFFCWWFVHDFATDLHTSGLNVKINEHNNRLQLTVHFRKLLLS